MPGRRRPEAGPLSVPQGHSVALALVFALAAIGLYAYKRLRPGHRPETLGFAISRSVLCAGAFAANGLLMGLDPQSMRLQTLAAAPVNLALVMLVAGICTLQARSFGTVDVSPRACALLRHAPRALLLSFSAHLVVSLIFPAPVLDRFSAAPAYYLLNRGLVTLPEAFFLGLAGLVSLQAAGSREPVGRIRAQHASFFGGQLLLVGVALNAYSAVCFRVFVSGEASRRSLIEAALARELWLAIGAAGLYLLGFFLYYSGGERGRAISRFSGWRRARQELDQRLWRLETTGFEDHYPGHALIPWAGAELADRAAAEDDERSFRPADTRAAMEAFKLFALGTRDPAALAAVTHYHQGVRRHPATADMSWRIAGAPDGGILYSVAEDRTPEAAARVRLLLQDNAGPRLLVQPQWFQLAALAAAESGVLPEERARFVLRPGVIMERVAWAYQNARFRCPRPQGAKPGPSQRRAPR